jgi:hypothetical protein
MNTANLILILGILSKLQVVIPEVRALVGFVLDLVRQNEPEMTNAELLALLRTECGNNLSFASDWFAAHPE